MKAIIMAGGLGTRLRPLTCHIPKPMVPVANRPILEHSIHLLSKHQITEVVFLLHYLPERIMDHFGDGSEFGVSIEYVTAGDDYGTAGAVKRAAHLIDDSCLIISGDALTDLNFDRIIESHHQRQALVTISLSQVSDPSPFGIVIMDDQERITRFLEKPSWGEVFSDLVNMGIYVLEPSVLEYIPDEEEYFFAKDLFPTLLAGNQDVYGFLHEGYWRDIGDLNTYRMVHSDLFQKRVSLETVDLDQQEWIVGDGSKLGKQVTFKGKVIIGENCSVEDGAFIANSVIGSDCVVARDATIEDSIVWSDVEIGAHSLITSGIVASNVEIGERCRLDENVIVSDDCKIGSDSKVYSNVKIWPSKEVDPGSNVTTSLVWGEKWQRELISDARVTGLANYEVTPEIGARLGAAFGAWIGKKNDVLVSRDATPAARMIYRSVMCGLMSAGTQVQDLQVAPIPIVRYTLSATKNAGGIHVCRSPLERRLLDVLIFEKDGRNIAPGSARVVERFFYREDFPRVEFDEVGDIEYPVRMSNAYVQDSLSQIDDTVIKASKFKIVLDYSHGSAAQVFSSILGSLDCEVIALNASQDAQKLSHTPVSFEKALQELSTIVKSTKAQIGFILDAGAEKVFCVDETGEILSSVRLAILITRLYLETAKPRKIAVKVSAPSQIESLASEEGVELVFTPEATGSLFNATKDPAVEFALDTEGGFIFPEFQKAFDGMYSIMKILELLAGTGSSLGELNRAVSKRSLVAAEAPCPWEAKGKVMRRLDEYSAKSPRLAIDGVKLYINGNWVLVTPHKEKALYNILAEAEDRATASQLVDEFKQKILDWKDS
ncbi:NTP transferase domain-containing protein [bacterium]|nr:NTP transferase domain-containing protein [bacterium]